MPELYKMLSREDTLKCRNNCKDWAKSVDEFLENFILENNGVVWGKDWTCKLFIRADQQRRKIQGDMEQNRKNSFIGKSVDISVGNDNRFGEEAVNLAKTEENYAAAHNLLGKFAKHIQVLNIWGIKNHMTSATTLKLLLDGLSMYPELKKLLLSEFVWDFDMDGIGKELDNNLSCPKHSHLAYFRSAVSQVGISRKIKSCSSQPRRSWTDTWLDEFSELKWDNLDQLTLNSYFLPKFNKMFAPKPQSLSVVSGIPWDFLDIYKNVKYFPQLKKLSLKFSLSEAFQFGQYQWQELLKWSKDI